MVHFGLGLGWLRLWCILGSFDPWAGLRSVYPNLTLIFTWPQYSLETDLDRLLWPKIVCFDPIKSTLWQGSSALVRIVCFDPWIVCFGPGSSALILFEDRLLWPSRIVCFGPYSFFQCYRHHLFYAEIHGKYTFSFLKYFKMPQCPGW